MSILLLVRNVGWGYLMSGTRLGRQIGPWGKHALSKAQKPSCCCPVDGWPLVDLTNQQGSVVTFNLASVSSLLPPDLCFRTTEGGNNMWYGLSQMSKATLSSSSCCCPSRRRKSAPSGTSGILLRFFEWRREASFASPHCFPNRHKVIFRSKTCKCFLVCNDVLLHFSFPWIGRCFA